MNDRIEALYQFKMEQLQTLGSTFSGKGVQSHEMERFKFREDLELGRKGPDLMEDPAYRAMSFMQRRAHMIKTEIELAQVRIYPYELLSGTFLEGWTYVPYAATEDERRAFTDMNLAFPRLARDNAENRMKEVWFVGEEALRDPIAARWNWGHICGGFPRILEMGYLGIAEDAERRREAALTQGDADREQIEFWDAVSVTARAVCGLSQRYALELDALADREADSVRSQELRKMAEMMVYVPARPPRTFWEALQSVWFSWMVSVRFNGTDLGRFDQYVYPYYLHDLEAGLLTEAAAEELIDCFFLKCFESYIASGIGNVGCHPSIMLGGVNADGADGTNPITYMCLRATERFGTPTPKISLRVNSQTPRAIFEQAHRMLLKGLNQPDFYCDSNIVKAYLRMGVPFEDAVTFAQSVCEEVSLAGISEDCTNEGIHCYVHHHVMSAMRRISGGEKAETFSDLLAMVEEEVVNSIRKNMEYHAIQTEKLRRFAPQPLHSAAIVGCLESGRDIMAGGAKYNNTGSSIIGIATAADSLYAIRQLVYEQKRLTMAQFYEILQKEYEGQEALRLEIRNKFPKFGNGVEEVDALAAHLFNTFREELGRHTNSRGGKYKVGAWASGHHNSYPATPDGRLCGEAFATNISPTPGRDFRGATAVLRSATRLDLRDCTGGGMIDVTMASECLKGENGPDILQQFVLGYSDMGGIALQFNIVSADVLKEAQKNASLYGNLMVRVWGYNDYFVALEKERQNHIIARSIQSF